MLGTLKERALDRASGARAIPGNLVRHFASGPEALDRMRRAIAEARYVVHFENYIIRDDRTGQSFADVLCAAAARGVDVRVLYDRVGSSRTSASFFRRLRAGGVNVRGFGRFRILHPGEFLNRDHRKYCAVDGRVAVLGGACIGDEWAGAGRWSGRPWHDSVIEICGPAVAALELAFARVWRVSGGDALTETPIPAAERCGPATVRVIDGVPGRFRLYRTVELLATGAASRLWVTEAYLLPPQAMYANLQAAARDGVDVRLLLPGRSDVPAFAALTRAGYRELLTAGVRIWEWRGPMQHAKTVLADDAWYKVGSSNLNASSLRDNQELDVLIEDVSVVQGAAAQFRINLSNSVEVLLRPRVVMGALVEGLALEKPARPASPLERSRRAFTTLRQVASGASRSLAIAVVVGSAGLAGLLVTLPRVMAYLLAVACLWTGGAAALRYFEQRRVPED